MKNIKWGHISLDLLSASFETEEVQARDENKVQVF
jgi:hypothetical protein